MESQPVVKRSDTTGILIKRQLPRRGNGMSSSYISHYYHLIFSVKDRNPIIEDSWRPRLHEYLGGCTRSLDGRALIVGGADDHVHLLVELSATRAHSDFMRDLKRGSSTWIHTEIGLKAFSWQEGYASFTVSASSVDEVWKYIDNQVDHHRHRTFLEELRAFLTRAKVPFDERYLA